MFGARCSLAFHIVSMLGSITSLVGSILTPTVFFNMYKDQNKMTDTDINMITGIFAGVSFGIILNVYILQRMGIIMAFNTIYKEFCWSRSNNIQIHSNQSADTTDDIINIHKNPHHYYIPSNKRIYYISDFTHLRLPPPVIDTSVAKTLPTSRSLKNNKLVFKPVTPGNIHNPDFKQSYAKYLFSPSKQFEQSNNDQP
jgi:hypothetical protein